MPKRGRVDPGALRRDRSAQQQRNQGRGLRRRFSEAVFPWSPLLVAAFEVARLAVAPIRGTAAWLDGILIGLVAGAAGVVSWWILVGRDSRAARWPAGAAAVVMCLLLLTTSGGRGRSPADVSSGYLAGAVTYEAVGLANMTVLFVGIPGVARVPRPARFISERVGRGRRR